MTKAQFKKLKVGDRVRLSKRVEAGKKYDGMTLLPGMIDSLPGRVVIRINHPDTVQAGKQGYWYTRQMLMPV